MASLRDLPRVDSVAGNPILEGFPPRLRADAARAAVDHLRTEIRAGRPVDPSSAAEIALQFARKLARPSLGTVVNGSGVVLHTGLGRARLAPAAEAAVRAAAASYSAVEYDLASGARGDRQDHVRGLLRELTGAEDAHVVNNCAAAVFLGLSALAAGGEVILSRGEMVEIGGSFRMPDIVRRSGARLVEVGCTNKTRLSDYEEALTHDTRAILRCHPSNFRIVGFAESPEPAELAALAHQRMAWFIDDVGSGCLVDTTRFGLPRERTLSEAVADGADLITASGDKLLGGPQAGIMLGTSEAIGLVRKHPLARAVRVDKLTLAGLEATLRLYTEGRESEIPTLRYLGRNLDELRETALRLAAAFPGDAFAAEGLTEAGSGSAPGVGVPTWRVALAAESPDELARFLRTGDPPIVPRIERDHVWLDPRTMEEDEVPIVVRRLSEWRK
ncbi:MAG: L-seryl-tRNA(Sec) selenium transferase [Fimbriimonadaceae bacterium]